MIEFKTCKDEKRLTASGSIIEIAAETCVIVEMIADQIKQHRSVDGAIYLLLVKHGLTNLFEEVSGHERN